MTDEVHNARAEDGRNIKGSTPPGRPYYFNNAGDALRPYVSAGSDQSIGQNGRGERNGSTFANLGGGAKYYFTEHSTPCGVEAQYNIDQGDTQLGPSVGIGRTSAAPPLRLRLRFCPACPGRRKQLWSLPSRPKTLCASSWT